MTYTIYLSTNAQKFIRSLNDETKLVFKQSFEELAINPNQGKLLSGNLKGLWSLRVIKYRVIYEINNNEQSILVIDIVLRKNIYK